ncbi:hypothetical protein FLK61_37905 [Paenalkalicoccus suaedae]|uniref:D-alanyl-D-alanine carboxypeptidase n=1 Tax=Paenalkalicoccus suaedae TaxID=2592382 RepID=A0A859FJ40_9BACI|nr:stalk domain-containing protein [Paenalkalicoccus suaedae]QKS72405.1 hypothetical protein FLK61_37905 [Paenalkalicoccus suaedae]
MHAKRIFSSVILWILAVSLFLPSEAFASSNIRADVEPYFIQSDNQKILATNPMITFNGVSYINTDDLHSFRISDGAAPLTPFMPKQTVNESSDRLAANLRVQAQGALIAENSMENVMYSKNTNVRLYPSSTTKVMTLYLALKYGNLSDTVVLSNAVTSVPNDSSKANVRPGDRMTLEQLLYGLMLPSGNDAAMAVAEHISGSVSNFVQLMNREAQELGMTGTRFTNPHGYHHPNHYSTSADIGRVMFAALEYDAAKRIMSTPSYTASYRNASGAPVIRTWRTTNHQQRSESPHFAPFIAGGKTGYTSASRFNLVSFAETNGNTYVSVVLRGERESRYSDTRTMMQTAITRASNRDEGKTPITIDPIKLPSSQNGVNRPLNGVDGFMYNGNRYVALSHIGESVFKTQDQLMHVTVNSQLLRFNSQKPVMQHNRLLVPVRELFEQLGVQVSYDPQAKSIHVMGAIRQDNGAVENRSVKLTLGSTTAYIDDQQVQLDVPATAVNGRTIVPVRFIAESLGQPVDWGKGRVLRVN